MLLIQAVVLGAQHNILDQDPPCLTSPIYAHLVVYYMQAQMSLLHEVLLQQNQHAPQAVSAHQPHAPVHSAALWPAPAYTNPAITGLLGNQAYVSGAISGSHSLMQPQQQQQQHMATPTTAMPPQGPAPPVHPTQPVTLSSYKTSPGSVANLQASTGWEMSASIPVSLVYRTRHYSKLSKVIM